MDVEGFLARLPEAWQARVTAFALRRFTLAGVARRSPALKMFARMLVNFGADADEMRGAMARVRGLQEVPAVFGDLARSLVARGKAEPEAPKARDLFHRAALYAFAADWFTLDDDAKPAANALVREAYDGYRLHALPRIERVEIGTSSGPIAGYFRVPEAVPSAQDGAPAVLIVQGFDSAKELWARLEEPLLARGFATLTIDQPGAGEALASGRKLQSWAPVRDAGEAALGWLRTHPAIDRHRVGIFGYSLGGHIAPRLSAEFPALVSACVGVGGPYDLSFAHRLPLHFQERLRYVTGADAPETLVPILKQVDLTGKLRHLRCPALVVHGGEDAIVPPEHARILHDELGGPKELRIIPGGDHALSEQFLEVVVPAAVEWFARHLIARPR
ncbi:MAG: alpha/beta fold hydrolase [Myxococcales bacterium]|nr:alpha/beta fold hydrolase [Myxococcales bacterium]